MDIDNSPDSDAPKKVGRRLTNQEYHQYLNRTAFVMLSYQSEIRMFHVQIRNKKDFGLYKSFITHSLDNVEPLAIEVFLTITNNTLLKGIGLECAKIAFRNLANIIKNIRAKIDTNLKNTTIKDFRSILTDLDDSMGLGAHFILLTEGLVKKYIRNSLSRAIGEEEEE